MFERSLGVHIRWGEDKTSIIALMAVVMIFLLFWYLTIYSRPITNYPTPNPETNKGVVSYGGSLANGVGARQNGGFVSVLEQELDITIANYARPKSTAHELWSNIDQVVASSPRIVILELGTTDAVVPTTPRYQVESRLERIVSTLHNAGSAVIILETASHAYGTMYRDVAYEHNAALVKDVLKPLRGKESYMFDEVHPNDAGHQKIAESVAPTLRRLLDQHRSSESDINTNQDARFSQNYQ